ncbi:MAG: hypothetical protein Q4Q19_03340 [Methanobrevibacter sp.]|nr:hypothetical protein [Methanobrevibacter sp.]
MSIHLLKSRVKEMKEGLESVDNLEPSLNNLHQRIYDLKMSLVNVDNELENIKVLTDLTVRRMGVLLCLKDSYITELKNLEVLL